MFDFRKKIYLSIDGVKSVKKRILEKTGQNRMIKAINFLDTYKLHRYKMDYRSNNID